MFRSFEAPRLYGELASWFALVTAPEEYAEEAAFCAGTLVAAGNAPARTLLELGSGGGNNASHLKAYFQMTLADLSAEMLAVSRRLNPECEHVEGDMRTLRLGRQFDRVFIQDAIAYMTSPGDLRAAVETAYVHCRPGGAALFGPDCVRETFEPRTEHGGHDGDGRALRYLEWTWDPDPADCVYTAEMVYLLREGGQVRVEQDRHTLGMFGREEWLRVLAQVGFTARVVQFQEWERFVAVRQA